MSSQRECRYLREMYVGEGVPTAVSIAPTPSGPWYPVNDVDEESRLRSMLGKVISRSGYECISEINRTAPQVTHHCPECEAHARLVEMMRRREAPYIEQWRRETGRHDALPDYGDMLKWLMEKVEEARWELGKYIAAYAAGVARGNGGEMSTCSLNCTRCGHIHESSEGFVPLCPRCQQLAALEREIGRAVIAQASLDGTSPGSAEILEQSFKKRTELIARYRALLAQPGAQQEEGEEA